MSKEAMEVVVRVATNDFDQDEGYFIVDQSVLVLLDDPRATVEEFEEAIRVRAKELGRDFIFTSVLSWDNRFQDLVIKIGWRAADRENVDTRADNGDSDSETVPVDTRDPKCVEAWPECHTFGYDPRCCRFPKSCSAG